MENNQIKRRIGAFFKALLSLSSAQCEVVEHDLRAIAELVAQLESKLDQENEQYIKAQNAIQQIMKTDYIDFREAASLEQMEQALIRLKHKTAELCRSLQIVF